MESVKNEKLKDEYSLKDVTRIWLSDECITPNNLPRMTQPSYGKYMIRTDGENDYRNQPIYVHPKILDNWTKQERGRWVYEVGKNDYFVHDINQKYTTQKLNFHPKYMPFKRLFPRSYTCELDYINAQRLCGMQNIENRHRIPVPRKQDLSYEMQLKMSCKTPPPFWWEGTANKNKYNPCDKELPELEKSPEMKEPRWRPVPNLLSSKDRTCCQRKLEFSEVGQPFHHKICRYYHDNFPAAKLPIFKTKFCP